MFWELESEEGYEGFSIRSELRGFIRERREEAGSKPEVSSESSFSSLG